MRCVTRMLPAAVLCAALATPVHAASEMRFAGVDVMTSTVLQEGQSSFSGIGLRARIQSQALIAGIELMPTIEYWRNSNSVDPFGIRTTRKDATLGFDAIYAFGSGGFKPYAGAGFGLHFLSSSVDAPALGINNQSHAVVKGGLALIGGATFPLTGRLENFIELKYHHVPDYRQLKINWGLAIKL